MWYAAVGNVDSTDAPRRTRPLSALFQHTALDLVGKPPTPADTPFGSVGLGHRFEFVVVTPLPGRVASESVMGSLALHRISTKHADTGGSVSRQKKVQPSKMIRQLMDASASKDGTTLIE